MTGLLCPICQVPLAETAIDTPAGPHCTNCGHVWRIEGDRVLALNSAGTHIPASLVRNAAPCQSSPWQGPLTAAKAAALVEFEVAD
jgi:Zn-finger nucleic acid-binding protein